MNRLLLSPDLTLEQLGRRLQKMAIVGEKIRRPTDSPIVGAAMGTGRVVGRGGNRATPEAETRFSSRAGTLFPFFTGLNSLASRCGLRHLRPTAAGEHFMGLFGKTAKPSATSLERARAWEVALDRNGLPDFVKDRLAGAAAGKGAWVATMTPAELLLSRSHGIRPVATVSGTCWFSYGWSWTEGHAQGWHDALDRIRREAVAAGANAVVDVRMRTLRHSMASSMDFTLIGTAVKIDRLEPSRVPVVSTVSALEFVRLLEADIVPTGIAVGARYDWLGYWAGGGYGSGWGDSQALWNTQRARSLFAGNVPLRDLMQFWEMIRRDAHADLRAKVAEMGNGVLAHTHFGQLIERERDKQPPAFLGRHIVIGTVVDAKYGAPVPHGIGMVVDMRDDLSPLRTPDAPRHSSYQNDIQDEEGGI